MKSRARRSVRVSSLGGGAGTHFGAPDCPQNTGALPSHVGAVWGDACRSVGPTPPLFCATGAASVTGAVAIVALPVLPSGGVPLPQAADERELGCCVTMCDPPWRPVKYASNASDEIMPTPVLVAVKISAVVASVPAPAAAPAPAAVPATLKVHHSRCSLTTATAMKHRLAEN